MTILEPETVSLFYHRCLADQNRAVMIQKYTKTASQSRREKRQERVFSKLFNVLFFSKN
jgi:hypothetical protein